MGYFDVNDSGNGSDIDDCIRGIVSGMAASRFMTDRRDPEITLIDRSMVETTGNISLLELDDTLFFFIRMLFFWFSLKIS